MENWRFIKDKLRTELYDYDKKLSEAFLLLHKRGTTLRILIVDINIRAWQLNVVVMLKY